MATRSLLIIKPENILGPVTVEGRYCHSDGYPAYMLPQMAAISANLGVQGLVEALACWTAWGILEADTEGRVALEPAAVIVDGVGVASSNAEPLYALTYSPATRTLTGDMDRIEWAYMIDPASGTVDVFSVGGEYAEHWGTVALDAVTDEVADSIQEGPIGNAGSPEVSTVAARVRTTWTDWVGRDRKDRSVTRTRKVASLTQADCPGLVAIVDTVVRLHPDGDHLLIPTTVRGTTWAPYRTLCGLDEEGRLHINLSASYMDPTITTHQALAEIVMVDGVPHWMEPVSNFPALRLAGQAHGDVTLTPVTPNFITDDLTQAFFSLADHVEAAKIAEAYKAHICGHNLYVNPIVILDEDKVRALTPKGTDTPSETAINRLTRAHDIEDDWENLLEDGLDWDRAMSDPEAARDALARAFQLLDHLDNLRR